MRGQRPGAEAFSSVAEIKLVNFECKTELEGCQEPRRPPHGIEAPLCAVKSGFCNDRHLARNEQEKAPSSMTVNQTLRPAHTRGPGDLAGWDPAAQLGFPGEFPFTRGI